MSSCSPHGFKPLIAPILYLCHPFTRNIGVAASVAVYYPFVSLLNCLQLIPATESLFSSILCHKKSALNTKQSSQAVFRHVTFYKYRYIIQLVQFPSSKLGFLLNIWKNSYGNADRLQNINQSYQQEQIYHSYRKFQDMLVTIHTQYTGGQC